ncbi:farnesyl diphosphate synthase 2 [Striga asiatica]|uniref:Farnesyl diphosphate synthase 2 n=1 Tax=Striga asiatica TaxID=4170 RepID=A0A5A7QN22_STRAF|nr:farnesyl diphosphate synthase 2 [Striga asiatica]
MFAGLRSRWMMDLGLASWRKTSAEATSWAIRKRSGHGSGGVEFFRKILSSRLPFSMNSYTRQLCSGQAPRRIRRCGWRILLKISSCKSEKREIPYAPIPILRLSEKDDVADTISFHINFLLHTAFFEFAKLSDNKKVKI